MEIAILEADANWRVYINNALIFQAPSEPAAVAWARNYLYEHSPVPADLRLSDKDTEGDWRHIGRQGFQQSLLRWERGWR